MLCQAKGVLAKGVLAKGVLAKDVLAKGVLAKGALANPRLPKFGNPYLGISVYHMSGTPFNENLKANERN